MQGVAGSRGSDYSIMLLLAALALTVQCSVGCPIPLCVVQGIASSGGCGLQHQAAAGRT